jgi:hypothetical protein
MGKSFHWECQGEAEKLLQDILTECIGASVTIKKLQEDLRKLTSTRLFDWIDHFTLTFSSSIEKDLEACGFEQESATSAYRVFTHPGAVLPSVVIRDENQNPEAGLTIKVERIADFLMVHNFTAEIEGSPYSLLRRASITEENGITLWAVERRGIRTMEPVKMPERHAQDYQEAQEIWDARPRNLDNDDEAMQRTIEIAERLVEKMGQEMAAHIAMEGERKYWQARNRAAQVQKNRQDRLGMGWENHDHHTFRSSRKQFSMLVRLFETLGFHCRERFYAGDEAGWGAQVMENSACGFVLFLDLDLAPEEVQIEFSHQQLPELPKQGTIGLWCALHGESILQASMHHLECQFDFDSLRKDLKAFNIGMMEPFSNFSYLKQAFTLGERWKVCPKRVQKLLKQKMISNEEAEHFLEEGAIGSHLENLERNEGFKGFNQKNVSSIIGKTDPRKNYVKK